jgi:putative membrane protein
MTRASVPLVAGLGLLLSLWVTFRPGETAGGFTAHMTLHLGVLAIVSPLVAFGLLRCLGTWSAGRSIPVVWPLIAATVEMIVVWTWHSPALNTLARADIAGFALEQASILAAGVCLWITVLAPSAGSRASAGAGIIALLLTSMHMTLLGALIALSPRELFICNDPGSGAWPAGLADQQLGGAQMLAVTGGVYLLAAVAKLSALLRDDHPEAHGVAGDDRRTPGQAS